MRSRRFACTRSTYRLSPAAPRARGDQCNLVSIASGTLGESGNPRPAGPATGRPRAYVKKTDKPRLRSGLGGGPRQWVSGTTSRQRPRPFLWGGRPKFILHPLSKNLSPECPLSTRPRNYLGTTWVKVQ